MKEKNNQRKTKLIIIIVLILVAIAVTGTVLIIFNTHEEEYYYSSGYWYDKVSCRYTGKYDIQYRLLNQTDDLDSFEVSEYVDYSNYIKYCEKWNLEQKYNYEDHNYIIFSYYCKNGDSSYSNGTDSVTAKLAGLQYNNNETVLYIWDGKISSTTENVYAAYVIIIPTKKEPNKVKHIGCFNSAEYQIFTTPVKKPIIYLYPTEETEVSVQLLKNENLTCSYPKYQDKWNVLAQPDGKLKDLATNRQLYSLYYESKSSVDFKVENEGFVVKGENTADFLEEKLAILGLTEREAEEFIIYWLPRLEANKYNYIRFATTDEINRNMPLKINPNPDTIIRVLMTFKAIESPIAVQEQLLETPNRTGFVAVEWGGTEIK